MSTPQVLLPYTMEIHHDKRELRFGIHTPAAKVYLNNVLSTYGNVMTNSWSKYKDCLDLEVDTCFTFLEVAEFLAIMPEEAYDAPIADIAEVYDTKERFSTESTRISNFPVHITFNEDKNPQKPSKD